MTGWASSFELHYSHFPNRHSRALPAPVTTEAGIHSSTSARLDPRLHGDDEVGVISNHVVVIPAEAGNHSSMPAARLDPRLRGADDWSGG
jgi:hypothetical protein